MSFDLPVPQALNSEMGHWFFIVRDSLRTKMDHWKHREASPEFDKWAACFNQQQREGWKLSNCAVLLGSSVTFLCRNPCPFVMHHSSVKPALASVPPRSFPDTCLGPSTLCRAHLLWRICFYHGLGLFTSRASAYISDLHTQVLEWSRSSITAGECPGWSRG